MSVTSKQGFDGDSRCSSSAPFPEPFTPKPASRAERNAASSADASRMSTSLRCRPHAPNVLVIALRIP